jgi:cell pole-organizing protein PopZ
MKDRETPPDEPQSLASAYRPASDVMESTLTAIQKLAALHRKKREQEKQPNTFEDTVRELMGPMLENWLDATVHKLVESTLKPELRRAFESR